MTAPKNLLVHDVEQQHSEEDPETKLLGNDNSRPASLCRVAPAAVSGESASPFRRSIRCERLIVIGLIVTIVVAGSSLAAVFVGRSNAKNNRSNSNASAEGDITTDPLSVADIKKLCPEGANTFSSSALSDEIAQRRGDFVTMLPQVTSSDIVTPNSCSSSNLAMIYLAANHLPETLNQETLLTRYVLTHFYFALGGSKWRKDDNWLSTSDEFSECTWYGIVCNEAQEITGLSFTHNNLSGSLPGDLHLLTSLEGLSLSQNAIKGAISTAITKLPHLSVLEISLNSFSGSIPVDIWAQTDLKILDLTRFGGSLQGIPTEIGLMVNLERFVAPDSKVMGTIPSELGRCRSLKLLDLSKNQLESTIPTHLGSLHQLQTLYLSGNVFDDHVGVENENSTIVPNEVCTLLETGRLLAFDLKSECAGSGAL